MRVLRACPVPDGRLPGGSPHDAADERFIQQNVEKRCARDGAPFPLLQFRSDTLDARGHARSSRRRSALESGGYGRRTGGVESPN